jgi:tetratricopeptide (TPR) repeat protein
MPTVETPIEVFCSYAHEDASLLGELKTHLAGLQRQGRISTWYDRQIKAGTNWAEVIDTHLESASLILLLVSSDFLASDYCFEIEMQRAMRRHEASTAQVIPIIVRPCDWTHTPFARLQSLPRDGKPVTEWPNSDSAWNDVTASIRRAIDDLSVLAASAPRATQSAIWNVPYPRNSFFTGRNDVLKRLHKQLLAGHPTDLSQPQAISGLGGIGKTQIAVEYAYRYRQEYEAVLWASAESQEALTSSYNTIAALLRLPEGEASEQKVTIQAVKRWLQTHRNWLFILDNADDLDLLPPFLPPEMGGHLLLTTRAWNMQRLAQRLEILTLSPEQGAVFLLRRAGLLTPKAKLSQAVAAEQTLALQLAREMGGLPLALEQAGAYLEATGMSLEQYQQVYQRHLLQERRARVPDHPEPTATTWSLSFARVREKNPAAADLLRLCAYLSPDAIPEEILTQGAFALGPLLEPVVSDPLLLGQAIEALRAYSLVARDPRAKTLSIHRLVQAVLQDEMDEQSTKTWAKRAIQAVHAALPPVEHKRWSQWERVVLHAQACAALIEQENITSSEATSLLDQTGYYLKERAQYRDAEPLFKQALATRKQHLGFQHLETAQSLKRLAGLYRGQGKYRESEPLFKQALIIYEQQLGPQHLETAQCLNNLGLLYSAQGKYTEAEPLLRQALTIREQQLGPQHLLTATSLKNVAWVYTAQSKYTEAEPLLRQALTIREQQLGPQHSETAQCLNNLGWLYFAQGKQIEAESLFKQALTIYKQQLGLQHPYTAQCLHNLAELYSSQGNHVEAESLFKQALIIREQQLGSQHPDTIATSESYVLLLGMYKK